MAIVKTFMRGWVQGYSQLRITSSFGWRSWNGKIELHKGVDIGIPSGTVLKAPLSGEVIESRRMTGFGLAVFLRHRIDSSRYYDIVFGHLHAVEDFVRVGTKLSEGQVFARSGGAEGDPNAGRSTGAHLHIEMRKNGNTQVDPMPWLLRDTLYSKAFNKIIHHGDPTLLSFDDSIAKTLDKVGKYSPHTDMTVAGETEYTEQKKKPPIDTVAKERLASGIWQITRLLIDSSVESKQVYDSGISTQTGSLLNFFRKVCQEPLVELMGDTYGSKYYWIVRRPPFDKENLKRLMDNAMFILSGDDILSTNLTWNNEEIYSWYRYVPYGDLLGVPQAQLFVPAVFFPEFASVWGSRPLAIESNYYNWAQSGRWNNDKVDQKNNGDRIIRNAVRDFKYLIESNAYNAFTRKGTITMNGDRRIKRGTLVRHISGEIFHVDSVQNEYSVNGGGTSRTTVLSVSKGMYPIYIDGLVTDGKIKSYFNIIDFGKLNIEKVTADNWREYISSWRVNPDSFGYFMSKRQVLDQNIF